MLDVQTVASCLILLLDAKPVKMERAVKSILGLSQGGRTRNLLSKFRIRQELVHGNRIDEVSNPDNEW